MALTAVDGDDRWAGFQQQSASGRQTYFRAPELAFPAAGNGEEKLLLKQLSTGAS
ncbi:cellulase (Glycosyl hydrolase family 5) [Anopheles sinensis]|uniref:Cellulase (Glycosyl hydrolase family 5) n=1 Tax=Anopheles sinensis TaxID=74873 RepID=A0A084VHG1_ANOSI|nr:cellulase (Glycosyl hydrolase family 5) [Anopheles sinensis]